MTGTRGWIERLVGPQLDAVLGRIDRSVTAEIHVERAQHLLSAPRPADLSPGEESVLDATVARLRADLSGEPAPAAVAGSDALRDLAELAFQGTAYEADGPERIAHRLSLVPGVVRLDGAIAWPEPSAHAGRWREDRTIATRVALGLAVSATPGNGATQSLAAIVASRPEGSWFLRRGARYGSASLLRGLIGLAPADPTLAATARRLCDRLLRHVEVRREACLAFRPETLPPDADPHLERARFALALLDAAREWEDLRYLNAALKLTDWRHFHMHANAAPTKPLALAHAACIAAQERVIREQLGA